MRRFRIVLASGVLVKVLEPALRCQSRSSSLSAIPLYNIRQAAMRRDPFQQAQSDLEQFVRRLRLQAFVFQVLH